MKNLILLLCFLSSVLLKAQDPNPVKWNFTSKKGTNPNEFIITATASIEKGWHVFAPDPGGDGLLIPTSAEFKPSPKKVSPLTPQRKPVTKNMEGVGMVNFYEGEIEFNITVESTAGTTLTGIMSFQCCNDNMCLPPKDLPFKVKL